MNHTNEHVQRTDIASRFERLDSNEMLQTHRAVRSSDGLHTAYPTTDATDSDVIHCFLDYDGTDPIPWEEDYIFAAGDTTPGTDGKVYRYIGPADEPAKTTNRPITGEGVPEGPGVPAEPGWESRWAVIQEIDVYCRINGGGNLEDADPHLLTMYKQFTCPNTAEEWEARWYDENEYVKGTNSREIHRCKVGHDGTVDNRPSSGDDWETYWEVAKLFAYELTVWKNKGVWIAAGTFEASFAAGNPVPPVAP